MLPLGGLFIVIFAGWLMKTEASKNELNTTKTGYNIWLILSRFVAPVAVMVVFLSAIGVINLG